MRSDAPQQGSIITAGQGRGGGIDLRRHVLLPLAGLALGTWLLVGLRGDQALAAWLYAWQGHAWVLKDHWLTEGVIHRMGRNLSIIAGVCVLALAVVSEWKPAWRRFRRPLLRLFVSLLVSTLVVSLLKKTTGMDCPWDLVAFGGSREFHGLFELRPAGFRASGCFPAGHASAGYGWLALYFLALEVKPAARHVALATGTALGLLFGISQQLRGAHFLSHDLWTAAICWSVSLLLFLAWPPQPENRRAGLCPAAR